MADEEYSSPIEFPCNFTVKVMGKTHGKFESVVLEIVRKHFPKFGNGNYKKRLSRDSNYLALSITVHAKSKKQLDALYHDLSDAPEVIMAL